MNMKVRITVMMGFLVLGGLSATAQEPFFIPDAGSLMTYTAEKLSGTEPGAVISTDMHRLYTVESLPLRDWMTEKASWRREVMTGPESAPRLGEEAPVQLRDWMMRPGLSVRQKQIELTELIKVDREKPIELQKWMYCCKDWRKASR